MSIIKADRVQMQSQVVMVDGDRQPRTAAVVLNRKGTEIASIEVTCGCGKTVILECIYDAVNESM